jgi:hypothetical protein
MKIPGLIAAGAVLLVAARAFGKKTGRKVGAYESDPDLPYGWRWEARRPPGLPPGARKTGIRGGALDDVRIIAARQGLGADFVRLVVSIASNESQGTYALPANPPQNAATGWGVFSYNRDAWHRLGNEGTYRFFDCSAPMPGAQRQMMWEASPQEEIEGPVREYACVWRKVMTEEGDTLAAARATRLWHRAPAYTKDFIRLATAEGFNWSGAWSKLEDRAEAQKGYMLASIDRTNADMREEGFA